MPIYAQRCRTESCGHMFEEVRPLSRFDQLPQCPKCDGPTEKAYVPAGTSFNVPAVVVYKAQDGTFRFPGDPSPHSRTAQQYEKLGYERVEAKGWADVRRLEKTVGKLQASEMRQRVERQCEFRETSLSWRRAEIRRSMEQGFSLPETDSRGRPTGRMKNVRLGAEARDLMRRVEATNDRKPKPQAWDTGFHVSAYSDNRSNRDEARRHDGKKFRD